MKRKFAAKLTTVTMSTLVTAALLAGCGNGDGGNSSTPAADGSSTGNGASANGSSAASEGAGNSDEQVTLTFYSWLDEEDMFNEMIEAYEKDHPNVKIEAQYVANNDYETKLVTAFGGGADIDCFAVANPNGLAAYVVKDQVLALDDLIASTGTDVSGAKATLDSIAIDGKTYGLPYKTSAWFVVYNKDVFDNANVPYPDGDWTWEEYAEVAAQLTSGEGADKIYGSLNFQPTSLWWRLPANVRGSINCRYEDQLDDWLDAAAYCRKLSDDGYQPPYADRAGEAGADYTGAFLTGKYGMMYNGDWVIEMLNSAIAGGETLNYDIAPMPHWEGEEAYTVGGPGTLQVAKNSAHPEEAFDFISFVTGAEGARLLLARDYFPAWSSDEIVKTYCEGKTAPEHIEYVVNQTIISQTPVDELYNTASNIVKEEVSMYLLGETDMESTKAAIMQRLKEENLLAE